MIRGRVRSRLRCEQLESRDAPATLVGNTKVTYQDADGDKVVVTFSKPILNHSNVDAVFGVGFVTGSNATKQQLTKIDLTAVGAVATGVNITTFATRSPVNGGDGFAAVGQIDATGIDLGAITINGDLGRVRAGDATPSTSGLKGLSVHSLGRFGTSTGAADLNTVIQGRLDFLKVKSDVNEASVSVEASYRGRIGPVTIGGSLLGGAGESSGRIFASGSIGAVRIAGNIQGAGGRGSGAIETGTRLAGVTIGGSLVGGDGEYSGLIASSLAMGAVHITGDVQGAGGQNSGTILSNGNLAEVTVGGSLLGGLGPNSGHVVSLFTMGVVKIAGNFMGAVGPGSGGISARVLAGVAIGGSFVGGSGNLSGSIGSIESIGEVSVAGNIIGGDGESSGHIFSNTTLAGVIIGGSLVGGAGSMSGRILASYMGTVQVAGDVQGGGGQESGSILAASTLAAVTIGGSLVGGAGSMSGRIVSWRAMGTVDIIGDLVGGSAMDSAKLEESGYIRGQRISGITLGGSLVAGVDNTTGTFFKNGAIQADYDIGSVLIKGSIVGNSTNPAIISARGQAAPTGTSDVAIGRIRVLGRVEFGQILAGVDPAGVAPNADAQIGPVFVGGDWVASSIAAGATGGSNGVFVDADDAKISGAGVKDEANVFSRIRSLFIAGQALGTVDGTDHFGIVAEKVGAVTIGGAEFGLTVGNGNDDIAVGITGDFRVNEI